MKKITKIAACGLLATLGLTAMASCGEENSLAKEVISKVILTQDGAKVSADFTVPKIVNHAGSTYDVSWVSSDTSVLNIIENTSSQYTADVKRPFGDSESANAEIKLTASVTIDGKTAKNEFKTTVECISAQTAIETAISNVGIKASYGAKTELDLPAKSNEYKDEISFQYSLGGEYASTKLEGNKLTLDPTLGQEAVVVKVKATSGEKVVEKDVNTKTSLKTVYLTATEALAQPLNAMIYAQGKIKSIASNGEKYGNFWIEDEAGKEIEVYGLYKGLIDVCYDAENKWTKKGIRYDAWDEFEKLAVGDYIYVYGTRAAYKDTQEISNCLLMGVVKDYPVSTVKEAKDTPKGDFVTVYGEVKSIASDKYGNLYLKDSEGNELYVYGLYTGKASVNYAEGTWNSKDAVRYDSMKDAPKVGDVIAVYGPMDEYKGTQQVKNGLLLYYISKTERAAAPEEPSTPDTPAASEDKTVTGTTITFESLGYANADVCSVVKFENGSLTFAVGSSEYNNVPKYYTDGKAVRMYGGNTLTIKSDKKIAKIEFTLGTSTDGKAKAFAEDTCSVSVGTVDYATSTWTGDANEVVLTYTPKAGHFRIVKVVVTYAE